MKRISNSNKSNSKLDIKRVIILGSVVFLVGLSIFIFRETMVNASQAQGINTIAPTVTGTVAITPTPTTTTPTYTISTSQSTSHFSDSDVNFDYDTSDNVNKVDIGIKASGNIIYVGNQKAPDTSGSYLQTFTKTPGDEIKTAIIKQVLSGYSTVNCPITLIAAANLPVGFQSAQINYNSDPSKCPSLYDTFENNRYFVINANNSDKLLFFSRGQIEYFNWGANLTIK